jgi:hypothetical protein
MSRSASEPLRPLTEEESKELQRVSRAPSELRIRHERAVASLSVSEGKSLSEAARLVGWKSHKPVTKVTRRFNSMGLCAPLRFAQAGTASKIWTSGTGADSARSSPGSRPQGRCHRNLVTHAVTARSSPFVHSVRVFEVAGTGWTNRRSYNGHGFHRMPATSPAKLDEQLPTAFSHRHHLRHAPAHSCTQMRRLLHNAALISSRSVDCIAASFSVCAD